MPFIDTRNWSNWNSVFQRYGAAVDGSLFGEEELLFFFHEKVLFAFHRQYHHITFSGMDDTPSQRLTRVWCGIQAEVHQCAGML